MPKASDGRAPLDAEAVRQRRMAGETVAQIANGSGWSVSYVSRFCSQNGIEGNYMNPLRIDKTKLVALHESGLAPREIAAQLGCSWASVTRILREQKLSKKPSAHPKLDLDEILALGEQGLTLEQIGAKLGYTAQHISKFRILNGYRSRDRSKRPDRKELEGCATLRPDAIAQKYNVVRSTVISWFEFYDLKFIGYTAVQYSTAQRREVARRSALAAKFSASPRAIDRALARVAAR